ncbi:MAG: hypothetical protein GWP63_00470 [Haliea sp.]|jgi:non-ribosomal peptide synthetase component E (peptide arylation enzyme)|nr:hypothetical protein [Haliea sp.]
MQAIGFRHFAKQSPNHLALAAPDGRHWSRGELLAECDRLVMNQSGSSPRQHASTGASLPNSAGLVAIALAFQIESPEQSMIDPPQALEKARARMLPLGIQPDTLNVHYCVSPGSDTDSLDWALASLYFGHPVVLADEWNALHMLRDIERYRVTSLYLSEECAREFMCLTGDFCERYDTSSMRHLVVNGTIEHSKDNQPLYTWFDLPPGEHVERQLSIL